MDNSSNGGNGNGNKKKVRCIECGKIWEKECDEIFNFEVNGGVSGTLCDACEALRVTPVIRRRQLKEGNFDCFLRAVAGYCDQYGCKYREPCLTLSSISIKK